MKPNKFISLGDGIEHSCRKLSRRSFGLDDAVDEQPVWPPARLFECRKEPVERWIAETLRLGQPRHANVGARETMALR
ncbi:hypothetical protein [Gemmobacter sp. 24YEA27]|uniref:hypothetical protein n=1 Tax=Gemmobacter sp. 24YEA27 TaxID=3040672 RepID=UPI0024B34AC0|nr:hypothetical protein [Gemmobacter sp. 24YEA27]